MPNQIQYSDKYFDDTFEYRYASMREVPFTVVDGQPIEKRKGANEERVASATLHAMGAAHLFLGCRVCVCVFIFFAAYH